VIFIKPKFNRELDDYIHKRKYGSKNPLKFKVKLGKDHEEAVPNLAPRKVHVVYKKPGLMEKVFPKNRKDAYLDQLEKEQDSNVNLSYMSGHDQLSDKEIAAIQREHEEHKKSSKPKGGFLGSLFKGNKKDDYVDMPTEEEPVMEMRGLDQETIEILKITSKWIGRLDGETKKEFKDSPDFAKYKAFLDKNGLTKKK
jgi:hypothetical protein